MPSREAIVRRLTEPGIVAIVRSSQAVSILPVAEALLAGGVTAVEITMTTPGALEALTQARTALGERALIGMGSVVNAAAAQSAIAAGAQFLVSPICRPELVGLAHEAGRPVMLGAYTPTEAQTAHEAGADFVKLFPADGVGPAHIKALRAPLPHLRIVPTGGVDLTTLAGFVKAGCPAVGVGSSLVSAAILRDADWEELTRQARRFADTIRAAKASLAGSV